MQSCAFPRKEHIEELFDLLPHETPSRGLGAGARSFGTGAYAKGPLQGLRKECGTFPQATKLLNAYVCYCFPDHAFTTSILFCNAKTDMHVDSRNHQSANAVMGISSFENGQIWVGDGCGRVPKQVQGRTVFGSLLDVARHPARFDAWKHPLVAFAVKSLALWSGGFRVLSVDAACNNADAPTAKLNVSQLPARQILWDLLAEYKPYAVHIGAPCSTVL